MEVVGRAEERPRLAQVAGMAEVVGMAEAGRRLVEVAGMARPTITAVRASVMVSTSAPRGSRITGLHTTMHRTTIHRLL